MAVFAKRYYICSRVGDDAHKPKSQKVGRSIALAIGPVRKVRTGKGTLLRKAQMGVIL